MDSDRSSNMMFKSDNAKDGKYKHGKEATTSTKLASKMFWDYKNTSCGIFVTRINDTLLYFQQITKSMIKRPYVSIR